LGVTVALGEDVGDVLCAVEVEGEGEVPMPWATVRVTVSLVQAVAPPLGD
jgi:hypothetical protein